LTESQGGIHSRARMKTFLLVGSLALLMALPVKAAEDTFYKPGISFDGFVSARSHDLNDARGGAGLGANLFFANNLGIGVEAVIENTAHSTIDTVQGNALWRITSGRAALNLLGGGGQNFESEEFFVCAGGGPEYAFSRAFHVFGDARAIKPIEGGDVHALFRAGVRLTF